MSEALQSTRSPVALLTMVHGALEPILMDYVDRLDPPMAGIVRYHFGWLDDTQPQSGARHRLVPLLYLSAEAAGGAGEHWVAPAVAYTLMGNCALMLDDILDDDRLRRGHPTVWARYGVPFAAQTSASLLGLAYEVLAEQRGPMMAEAARRMSVVVRAGGAAQLRDVELERRVDVTLDEALAVTAAKTAAIVGLACTFGALAGGASPAVTDDLTRFGRAIGMIFQLTDDMEELLGDPAQHGQQPHRDLHARKKTPMVVGALASPTPAGAELRELFGSPAALGDAGALRCADLIERCGGRDWAYAAIAGYLAEAECALERAVPDPVLRSELAGYARRLAAAADR